MFDREDRRAGWFEFTEEQMDENDFGMIHRRIEWFMHFFIDAMSSIDLDSRWRCFVAARYFQTPSPLSCCQREEASKRAPVRQTLAGRRKQLETEIRKVWPKTRSAILEEYAASLDGKSSDDLLHVSDHFDALLQKPSAPFEILGLFTVYQVSTQRGVQFNSSLSVFRFTQRSGSSLPILYFPSSTARRSWSLCFGGADRYSSSRREHPSVVG